MESTVTTTEGAPCSCRGSTGGGQRHYKMTETKSHKAFNLFPSGVVTGLQPTCLPKGILYGVKLLQQRERHAVAEGILEEANAITKKTTETESRPSLATGYACTVPGGRFPAKFGCRPIKLELYLPVHTYTANYVRVHFRHLGVYKASQVA